VIPSATAVMKVAFASAIKSWQGMMKAGSMVSRGFQGSNSISTVRLSSAASMGNSVVVKDEKTIVQVFGACRLRMDPCRG
jgi:hypothetical protein